jgi:hypothetical protein
MVTKKLIAVYVLGLVLAFFAGRAWGWHEADVLMEKVAREFGAIAGGVQRAH